MGRETEWNEPKWEARQKMPDRNYSKSEKRPRKDRRFQRDKEEQFGRVVAMMSGTLEGGRFIGDYRICCCVRWCNSTLSFLIFIPVIIIIIYWVVITVSDTMLSTLHTLSHVIVITNLWTRTIPVLQSRKLREVKRSSKVTQLVNSGASRARIWVLADSRACVLVFCYNTIICHCHVGSGSIATPAEAGVATMTSMSSSP